MSYLEVPGASLYYESVGNGPMLLCISGADGSVDIWRGFGEAMKDHFTVVMWDRRGFSRSYLKGSQDYEHRLETDADDAARLIKHISPDEPATVIGNSSGAIVSLKLLIRHPEIIRTLMPYEPPAYRLLPDFEELNAIQHEVYNLYRKHGIQPALAKFVQVVKAEGGGRRMGELINPRTNPYVSSNVQYWFEREFLYYPPAEFDIEKELRPLKDKLLIVNGERTDHEAQQYRANILIGERLGLDVLIVPGEHVGHATDPVQFGQKIFEALKAKDQYYTQL